MTPLSQSTQDDPSAPHVSKPEITKPSLWFPLAAVVALLCSAALVIVRMPPWSPFIGYALAPLAVILALTLAIWQRNRHAAEPYFEHTDARRYIQILTVMAFVSLIPAGFHSLQIARELTLWLTR